jgi:hypothetical protein
MIKNRYLVAIIVVSCLTALSWVIFDILHSRSEVKPSPEIEQLLEPVSPNFDEGAIKDLQLQQ